jgi:alpha-acetolactate decarboxylase
MPTQGLDNKISNIIGAKLPQWVMNQLVTRSNKNTQDSRDNDNLLYVSNKTAWVRLVSSINIVDTQDLNYFKRIVGESISSESDLAKQFVLFGGTSKYLGQNSYAQRSGLGKDGAYGILGNEEIQKYGYRPMPGITSVNIETQGRLGSVRAATISFKCWDKSQLDIIDALYFKLGFTMFLEWGHTYFYPNPNNNKKLDPNKVQTTELYSIDPFEQGLNKEDILSRISQNSRDTDGNYDAMLGIVTNFNFTYSQDGGFDCTVRLMALGVLGDSIKINNPGVLPDILKEEIIKLNNTLFEISEAQRKADEAARNKSAQTNTENKDLETKNITANELFNKYIKYDPSRTGENKYSGGQIAFPSDRSKNPNNADAAFNTQSGWVYLIRRLNGYIPLSDNLLSKVNVSLENQKFLSQLNSINLEDNRLWEYPSSYLESTKDIFVQNLTNPVTATFRNVQFLLNLINPFKPGENITELDKKNDVAVEKIAYKSNNGSVYNIEIKRKVWGTTDRSDVLDSYGTSAAGFTFTNSAYYYIDTPTFAKQLKNVISNPNNTFKIKNVDPRPNDITTTFYFKVPFTRQVKVVVPAVTNPDLTITPETLKDDNVTFNVDVELSINDSALIKSFTTQDVIQPIDFLQNQKNIANQNQQQTTTQETQALSQEALSTQISQALNYQSSLEIILRTIQVHALNEAIGKSGTDIGRQVFVNNFYDDETIIGKKKFLEQIFSNGIFGSFIRDLIDNSIQDFAYTTDKKMDPIERFKIQSKYGFATNLMANKAAISELQGRAVNFKEVLRAFVVPYQINQEIIKGTQTNHPVYIPLGLLLMILNHTCTIYDTKGSFQTPLVYIDFNPELNFFLTNTKQLSTNPWKTLIPFEGSFEDYKKLFDPKILGSDSILPVSGSTEKIPLFNPQTQDVLSGQLPKIKFGALENNTVYRGRMMNILLNVDYLVSLTQQYSAKDTINNVYLKPFLEQLLADLNKFLGNFNAFRLSYSDSGNTFQLTDDQFIPALSQEDQISAKQNKLDPDNRTEIPLIGKFSIAKSLEIKTEIASKLANMIAISANSTVSNKSTLSTNGSNYGYINTNYVDRYITDRQEPSGSTNVSKELDTIKISASQFNQTISDFYSKINPSEATVSHATNYYIEKMSRIKNDEYPTRASAMIPVSLNFTTDGIAGMSMGQAFTISDELLPYTYSTKKVVGLPTDHVNNVGFVMVGLIHTIENNSWNTAVRANMIFLKDKTEFSGSVTRVETRQGEFQINANNQFNTDTYQQTNFKAQSPEAKKAAENYLGKLITDTEWSQLVAATYAEASSNQTERAWVMAVILNRTRNSGKSITDTLTAKNQFQAVTGTSANGNRPSPMYVNGPDSSSAAAIYGAAVNILSQVPTNYVFFTSNNEAAYGAGTDISFLFNLRNKPNAKIIGKTVFSTTA